MKIGIVGNGFVGGATSLFGSASVGVIAYDMDSDKCHPYGTTMQDMYGCDLVFICLPTPESKDGSCDTVLVEKCIYELNITGVKDENIIVRSTVPVGFCDKVGVNFMPEFLTEAQWEEDFRTNPCWIFGEKDKGLHSTRSKIIELLTLSKSGKSIESNEITFCSTEEAELIKLTKNAFLATKVSFFNEIKEFCDKRSINYDTVSDLVSQDKRIGVSHTKVPGPDGKTGYGGSCFPKDISSLNFQMSESGMDSFIIEASKSRNLQVDRKKDWSPCQTKE